MAQLTALAAANTMTRRMTGQEIQDMVESNGGLAAILKDADAEDKTVYTVNSG